MEALSTILVLNRRSSGAGGSAKFLCTKCGYIFWGSKKAVITHLTQQQQDRGVKIHPCLLAMTPGVCLSMIMCAQAGMRACARAHWAWARAYGCVHVHARVWVAPVTAGADTLPAGDCARACQKARARKLPHPETERPPTEERQVCEAKVASWSSRIGSSAGGAPKPRHDQAHGRARGAGVEGARGSERAEGKRAVVGGIAPMLSICIYIYLRGRRLYVSIAPHTRPPPLSIYRASYAAAASIYLSRCSEALGE